MTKSSPLASRGWTEDDSSTMVDVFTIPASPATTSMTVDAFGLNADATLIDGANSPANYDTTLGIRVESTGVPMMGYVK